MASSIRVIGPDTRAVSVKETDIKKVVISNQTATDHKALTIHVVYAQPDKVWQKTLLLPPGTTVGQALVASEFSCCFPDHPSGEMVVGIYGRTCSRNRVLTDEDRIEIYRPLVFDPMQSRRRRALHRKAATAGPHPARTYGVAKRTSKEV
ncbi:MAG: RnfH family protein [Burkholderiaceae bacterium]|nr:MAG: RnfH family protein [Burkholderiaceae bacterium]TAM05954.1 MAG: RnfH family protein [Pusillimonas sp.]